MKYENRKAIIDCGTNTFHLLIVDTLPNDRFTVVHKEKQVVKISAGCIQQNIIPKEGIERALKTLSNFRETIDSFHVISVTATATSAFRNATNGQKTADFLYEKTAIKINIIDGTKEATLIYNAVSKAITLTNDYHLIMDIGGGSVEFILCNKKGIKWLKSFEIGGQRLLEKFHLSDPISQEDTTRLNTFLDDSLQELFNVCKTYQPTSLLGASGSFDTLSEIYYELSGEYFDENETLSFNLPIDYTLKIIDDIVSKTRAERLEIKGMIPMRVDMIVVAGLLVKEVVTKIDFKKITTTSYALKEGLLFTPSFEAL